MLYINGTKVLDATIQIVKTLNEISVLTLITTFEVQVGDYVDYVDIFSGEVISVSINNLDRTYTATVNGQLDVLNKEIFTRNSNLETNDFTQVISVNELEYYKQNITQDILRVNLDVSGQSYFEVLRRLSELKNFAFFYDYSTKKIQLGLGDAWYNNDLFFTEIITDKSELVNRIYPFSNDYDIYSLQDIYSFVDLLADYPIKENEKGVYIEDKKSVEIYGLHEQEIIINDFPIKNVFNEQRADIINSVYLTAISRLQVLSEPTVILNADRVTISDYQDMIIGMNYTYNDNQYIIRQVEYTEENGNLFARPTLSNKISDENGVLNLLRRLNRNDKKGSQNQNIEIKEVKEKLNPYEKKEASIDINFETITKVEAYLTIEGEQEITEKPTIKIANNSFNFGDIEEYKLINRIPTVNNFDLTQFILSRDVDTTQDITVSLTNNDEVQCEVTLTLLIQYVD